MILVMLVLFLVSLWLFWEWWTGALAPATDRPRRRLVAGVGGRSRSLPTSAALNADAAAVARNDPRT